MPEAWALGEGEEYVVNTDVTAVLQVQDGKVMGAVLNRPMSCSVKFALSRLGRSTAGPMAVFDDWWVLLSRRVGMIHGRVAHQQMQQAVHHCGAAQWQLGSCVKNLPR